MAVSTTKNVSWSYVIPPTLVYPMNDTRESFVWQAVRNANDCEKTTVQYYATVLCY